VTTQIDAFFGQKKKEKKKNEKKYRKKRQTVRLDDEISW